MVRQGQATFNARVARINAGHVSCMPRPGVSDGSGGGWMAKGEASRIGQRRRVTRGKATPLAFVVSLVLGVLSYVLSQYAWFHLMGLPDTSMTSDIRMAVEAVAAVAVLLALSQVFSASSKLLVAVRLVGIALAMVTLHNLVHIYPDIFEMAVSRDWVNTIKSMSEPNSILFRGVSYTLS
ncbi:MULTISPECIES: hypothetical protein [unclassified Marinovum]